MGRWYRYFKSSRFFGSFLRTRYWIWRTAPSASIFSLFLIGIPWLWLFGPILAGLALAFLIAGVLELIQTKAGNFIIFGTALSVYVAILPVTWRVFADTFLDYFAVLGITFGKTTLAEERLRAASRDYNNWLKND
ncbi:hypothetical protein NBRC116594_04220 [Shimia sp. NS0008-38b]